MGKDGQLGQRGWIRRRGGRVIRVLHLRVVDLGVLGARVSGARWVTARASYRESMFPIATPHGVRASRRPAGAPATAAESDARATRPKLLVFQSSVARNIRHRCQDETTETGLCASVRFATRHSTSHA